MTCRILSEHGRHVLRRFARSNGLVAFDYDGTLAPIVADPRQATMRATTRRLLRELTRLYPCIVISGRARADTIRLLGRIDFLAVLGNHGAEPCDAQKRFSREVHRWRRRLRGGLGALRGVKVEDKGYSLAIHYRHSPDKRKARAAIAEAAARLEAVRVVGGKQVVNLMLRDAPNKGTALESERKRLGCDTAIYVGDDDTDEDVFVLGNPRTLLSIRVGVKKGTLAHYCIRSQAEIDGLLASLIGFRQGWTTAGARARAPRARERR